MNNNVFRELTTPLPKQEEALSLLGTGSYIFYGGRRGIGKTYLTRMAAIKTAMLNSNIKVVVVGHSLDQLKYGFIKNILNEYPSDIFKYKYIESTSIMFFFNDSFIKFCVIGQKDDIDERLSCQLMLIDDANSYDESIVSRLLSVVGSSPDVPYCSFKPTCLMTGNPGGISDDYFRDRWIEPNPEKWNESDYNKRFEFVNVKMTDNNKYITDDYLEIIKKNNMDSSW